MKPLELEIRVSVTTDDPREVLRARENIARSLNVIDAWLENFAPRRGTEGTPIGSRPAPLSAETPGDRENAARRHGDPAIASVSGTLLGIGVLVEDAK